MLPNRVYVQLLNPHKIPNSTEEATVTKKKKEIAFAIIDN